MARDKAGKYRSVHGMSDIYASNTGTRPVSMVQVHSFCRCWGRNMPEVMGHNNRVVAVVHNILANSHSHNSYDDANRR